MAAILLGLGLASSPAADMRRRIDACELAAMAHADEHQVRALKLCMGAAGYGFDDAEALCRAVPAALACYRPRARLDRAHLALELLVFGPSP